MLVWAHHMFATPLSSAVLVFFMLSSMAIAIPTGVKVLNWVATLFRGSIALRTPLYFAAGFLVLFTLGGITGVMLAIFPIDRQVTDTYFVVAHFHFVLVAGSVSAVMAAVYYWFPKITGRMLSERIGKLSFWLQFVGFLATFLIQHSLGLSGMPRRIYTYSADKGWGTDNLISTVGAYILAAGVLLTLANVLWGLRHGRVAGPDPWKGNTLEWFTTSPPPAHNFDAIPRVRSVEPMKDIRDRDQGTRRGRNEPMSDTKLMIAIGILHLVALGVGGGLLLLAFRGGDGYDHPHSEGGRGPDQPPDPPRRPIGGPPLPERQARPHSPARTGAPRGLACSAAAPRAARAVANGTETVLGQEPTSGRDSHAQDTARPSGGRRNVPQTACRLRRFTARPTSLDRSGRPGPDEQRQVDADDRRPRALHVGAGQRLRAGGRYARPQQADRARVPDDAGRHRRRATRRSSDHQGPHARTRRSGDRRRGEGERSRPDRHGIARAR